MRSPKIAGEECPFGKTAFQRTFVVGPTSLGSGSSRSASPVAFGPRNWAQFPAERGVVAAAISRHASVVRPGGFLMEIDLLMVSRSHALRGNPGAPGLCVVVHYDIVPAYVNLCDRNVNRYWLQGHWRSMRRAPRAGRLTLRWPARGVEQVSNLLVRPRVSIETGRYGTYPTVRIVRP